jgi:hypothetical protein
MVDGMVKRSAMKTIIPAIIAILIIVELIFIYDDFSHARAEYEHNQINYACEDCPKLADDWFLLQEGETNE